MRLAAAVTIVSAMLLGSPGPLDQPNPPGNCRNRIVCDFGACPPPECGPREFLWLHPCDPRKNQCKRIPGCSGVGAPSGIAELTRGNG